MTFDKLNIVEPILRSIEAKGYTNPTPIQEQAIPVLLEKRDLLGCAQTGTGKTAAFAIPILQNLLEDGRGKGKRKIKALVVTPTRELAIQIKDSFTEYGLHTDIENTVVFGGVKQGAQTQALEKGVDVLVATPGRLLDLMNQGFISLRDIRYFVLDEADQMLDMGFIYDIRRIIDQLPKRRQSLFFSATMPPKIVSLSKQILGNPEKITIQPQQTTAERVEQSIYFTSKRLKSKLLTHLLKSRELGSTLVFSRTKYGADKIARILKKADIKTEAIHGNKTQNSRQKALNNFKEGTTKVLVATDIAARGIDVAGLALVVNYDLPNIPESYVHRIGRTGRANASGVAISFCSQDEMPYLKDIQRLIKKSIPVVKDHPFPAEDMPELPKEEKNLENNSEKKKPRSRSAKSNNSGKKDWRRKSNSKGRSGSQNRPGSPKRSGKKRSFKR
ncbi:DEAD/DEAH box helicase [Marinifilum caeruleilacunae]|uniref:DEAD/DEAH box helicase n=1 Tax=Marinifilum caeruleilacunae TaxID=2499076 RepID=A0ABX1WX34_9BACT|nr:DEAD/DEAH box helicase [Marinifilum caeruleilacunae]NOU60690.1 DEAD/DEAH box helicase [Marinifilum caeruleilacunae]